MLGKAAQAVSRHIQQTQIDVGRLQTELELRGIRGVRADQQPALLQLRQELSKYQNQYRELQQRGARTLAEVRQVVATRVAAIQRYQIATGEIIRKNKSIDRWNKTVEKSARKIKKQQTQKQHRSPRLVSSLQRRLSQPASYFKLDGKAELRLLIEQAKGN